MARKMSIKDSIKQSQGLAAAANTNQLAAEQGLVAPPVTAVGVGALGGTPQQQAMAGTPAQKRSALAPAPVAPAPVVAAPVGETAIEKARATQGPAAIDTARQAEMQKYSQSLGTFGDKVNQWIKEAEAATLANVTPQLQWTEDAQKQITAGANTYFASIKPKAEKEPPKKLKDGKPNPAWAAWDKRTRAANKTYNDIVAKTNAALAALLDPANTKNTTVLQNSIFELNKILGKDTTAKLLEGTGYGQLLRDVEESIGEQAEAGLQAETMGKDKVLTLSDIEDIGTSYEELGRLLGITPEQAQGLTLNQLQQKLADVQQRGFSETAQTAAQMSSAFLSQTEREALRGTMKQMEEAGIVGIETQFQQLLDDIDAGQNVTIGNKTFTIDTLLADGTFSDLIADFYADPDKTGKLAQSIKQEEPELYKFLVENQEALIAMKAAGEGKATELKDFNVATDETRKIFDGTTLLEDAGLDNPNYLTGTVIPVGTKLDWTKGGTAIAQLVSLPPEKRQAAVTSLQNATNIVRDNGGTPEEIKQILALDLGTATNTKFQSNLTSAWVSYSDGQAALQSDDAQTLVNALFATDPSLEQIQAQLQEDSMLAEAGLPTSEFYAMDKNHDGTLDVAELQALAKDRGGKPDINAIAAGKGYQGMDGIKTTIPQVPANLSKESTLGKAYADGEVTADELSGMTLNELEELFTLFKRPGEQGPAQGKIAPAIREAYLRKLDQEKVDIYSNKGLGTDGAPAGLLDLFNEGYNEYINQPGSASGPRKLGQAKGQLENTINILTEIFNSTTNEDLRLRIEQDINRLREPLGVINNIIANQDSGSSPPMETQLFKTIETPVQAVGEAVERAGNYVAKRVPKLG